MVEKQNEAKQQSENASVVEFRKLAELLNNRLEEQQMTLRDELCSMVYSAIEEMNFQTMNTMKKQLEMEKQRLQTCLTAFQSELTEIVQNDLIKMKEEISKELIMMTSEVTNLRQEMNMLKQNIQAATDENRQHNEVSGTQGLNHVSSNVQKLTEDKGAMEENIPKPGIQSKSKKKKKHKKVLCFRCQKCGHVMRNCQTILNNIWNEPAMKGTIPPTVNEINQLSGSLKRNNQMENQQHTDQIIRLIQNQPEEGEDVHAESENSCIIVEEEGCQAMKKKKNKSWFLIIWMILTSICGIRPMQCQEDLHNVNSQSMSLESKQKSKKEQILQAGRRKMSWSQLNKYLMTRVARENWHKAWRC